MRMCEGLMKLSAFLILCVLSACATASTGPASRTVTSEYCRIAKPISYDSTHDTPQTVRAVEAHNSAWVCVCEGDCPKP